MRTSPIQVENLSNRLSAIVEEMAENIRRTSFSVFVKQTADFGTCLVTPDGEVVAAPRKISGNLMIGIPTRAAIESLGPYEPGDIGISNDPDATRGLVTHLPDVWMWAPLYAEGELIAFAFTFIHASDIGGSVPGSITWGNTDRHQEGLLIPPVRLYRRGRLDEGLQELIVRNTRVPEENRGDLQAQRAGLATAQRRIDELVARYGRDIVVNGMADLLDQAGSRASAILASLPDGEYSFVDYVEGVDGQDGIAVVPPIRLALTLRLSSGTARLSFEGTSPQVAEAVNLPTGGESGHYMLTFALVNYFCSVDRTIPYNSGLVRAIESVLPEGSIVNPRPGATCGVRAAVFFRIMDCVLGCLAQADPARAMATSSGAVAIATISYADPATGQTKVLVGQPLTGGSGGRPGRDGLHGTSYTGGWLRNVPTEVLEQEAPVLVERYGYRPDSGGAGEFPGGAGVTLRIRALADGVTLAVRGMERLRFQPWGVAGGRPGAAARAVLNPGTPREREIGRVNVITLDAGDVLHVETAGGGGLGGGGDALFDFGAARESYERKWPQPVQEAMVAAAFALPAGAQPGAYRRAYLALDRRTAAVSMADVAEAFSGEVEGDG